MYLAQNNTEHHSKHAVHTDKHGGGDIKIWGYFNSNVAELFVIKLLTLSNICQF